MTSLLAFIFLFAKRVSDYDRSARILVADYNIQKLFLLSVMFAGLSYGLVDSPSECKPKKDDTVITIAIPSPARSLNPNKLTDTISFSVANYLHEPLFEFDNISGFTSNVIQSWTVSKDGLRYAFEIKPNVVFHNGQVLTSQHVINSLKNCLKNQACSLTYIDQGVRFQLDGPLKFSIILKKKNPLLLCTLSDLKASIIPTELYNTNPSILDKPIGAGPYHMVYITKDEILLKRFEQYMGKKGKNNYIRFVVIPDMKALRKYPYPIHDINQVLPVLPETNRQVYLTEKGYHSFYFPSLNTNTIFINFRQPRFHDIHLRAYLFSLFRNKEFVNLLSPLGQAEAATGFISLGMLGYLPKTIHKELMPVIQQRLTSFKKNISSKANTLGAPIELITYLSKDRASIIQKTMNSLGLKKPSITIHSLDKKNFYSRLFSGHYDLALATWIADFTHPMFYLSALKSNNEYNFGKINDPKLDNMLAEFTGENRKHIHDFSQNVDRYVIERHYLIPISYNKGLYYFPKEVKGFKPNVMGIDFFDHSNTIITK